MEIKKSKQADLERQRWMGYFIGIAVAASLMITAIEYTSNASSNDDVSDQLLDNLVKDLTSPAVDQQDISAQKPQTVLQNEILTPAPTDKPLVAKEESDFIPEKAQAAENSRQGSESEQLSAVRETKEKEEEIDEQPQKQIAQSPPAPLDPVPPADKTVTNTPVPPGGWADFNKWMAEQLKYPKTAEKQKIKGDVVLSFVIETDGTLSNLKIAKSAHALLDAEALRVAKLMENWKPGLQNGAPCRSYVELPISFNL